MSHNRAAIRTHLIRIAGSVETVYLDYNTAATSVLGDPEHPGFVLSTGLLSSEDDQHFHSLCETTPGRSICRNDAILQPLRVHTSTLCCIRIKSAILKVIRIDTGPVSLMRFEIMSTLPCFTS